MLIVETGIGIADANSYVSLEEANSYHALYNNLDWAATDSELEQALILATRSVDLLYGPKFISYKRVDSISPLLFPRYSFYDNNFQLISQTTIPKCLKNATCQLALMQLLGEDILPIESADSNIKMGRIKIGDIEIENEYQSNKKISETYTGFNQVELLLQPILKTKTRTSTTLVR
jgi:hypothetical protein